MHDMITYKWKIKQYFFGVFIIIKIIILNFTITLYEKNVTDTNSR